MVFVSQIVKDKGHYVPFLKCTHTDKILIKFTYFCLDQNHMPTSERHCMCMDLIKDRILSSLCYEKNIKNLEK